MYKICWLPESMVSPFGSLGTILLRFSFLLLTTGTKRMVAGERRSYWPKCSGKPFNPILYFCCNGSLVYSGRNISVKLAVVGGSCTMPPSPCAAMANSSLRLNGIRPAEVISYRAGCQM